MSVKKIAAALVPAAALLVLLVPAEAAAADGAAGAGAVPEKFCSAPVSLSLPLPDLLAQYVPRPVVGLLPRLSCVNGWQ
ncbi:hypothetical protein [Streptomyces sp. NPDC058701]|uniref:hypothetical protein n=1 Tax=Streptomyces sp. NPDC058701 TaxID=3346608 RepID=UPI003656369F